jgi:hypothetical protein
MQSMPKYIKNAGIIAKPIEYKWEPDLDMKLYMRVSRNLMTLMDGLSCEATFTAGIGIGEWLLWRLEGLSTYAQVYLYCDALWARTVNKRYLKVICMDVPDDDGEPISGPLYALENKLFAVATDAVSNDPERPKSIAELVMLVRYTLPNPEPFDAWLKTTISRLSKVFPYNKDNPHTAIVPRKFLDPEVPIDLHAVPIYLDEQLQQIEYTNNPFLASPEELKAAGFEGEPYRYKS